VARLLETRATEHSPWPTCSLHRGSNTIPRLIHKTQKRTVAIKQSKKLIHQGKVLIKGTLFTQVLPPLRPM